MEFNPARIVSEVLVYLTDGDDTLGQELWEIFQKYAGYLSQMYNKKREEKTACEMFTEFNDANAIYIRLSPSFVYIDQYAVYEMVKEKLTNPEHLLVSGNVVNNREISVMHDAMGVYSSITRYNEVRYEEKAELEVLGIDPDRIHAELPTAPFGFDNKHGIISTPHAYLQHLFFLKHIKQEKSRFHDKPLNNYKFSTLDFNTFGYESWTPDVITFSGADVNYDFSVSDCEATPLYTEVHPTDRFSGMSKLDYYLTGSGFSKRSNKHSVAVGNALVVVFMSHHQHLPFYREAPYTPYDIEPRRTYGYIPDDMTIMDPYINAAMSVLADLMPESDDDAGNFKPRDPEDGDDGVRLSLEEHMAGEEAVT